VEINIDLEMKDNGIDLLNMHQQQST